MRPVMVMLWALLDMPLVRPDAITIPSLLIEAANGEPLGQIGPFSDGLRRQDFPGCSYPIMRFDAVPDRADVHIIDRPNQPFLGSGETAQGPTAAAIGVRLRDLPLSHERIRAAVSV